MRISVGVRRWQFLGIRNSAAHRLDGSHSSRRTGGKFWRESTGDGKNATEREIHFPGSSTWPSGRRPEGNRWLAGIVVTRFRFSYSTVADHEAHQGWRG